MVIPRIPSCLIHAFGLFILAGCAAHPINGQFQTKDNQALLFSADGDQLLLTPGPLSADFGERPDTSGHIRLKNAKGEVTIKTIPENFTYNHFQIDKTPGKLSTDLKGVWRENTQQVYSAREVEYCTAPGYCPQSVKVVICPDKNDNKRGNGCHTHYETRMLHAWDCPGHKLVEKTYQSYTVSLELEFLNPANKTDRLAHFQGTSIPRKRVVSRQEIAPCLVR